MLVQKARMRPVRVQTQTDKAAQAAPVSFPAPTAGWVENTNIASGLERAARVSINGFPTSIGYRARGGKLRSATVGARAYSIFRYRSATLEKLFAATAAAVYDISALNPTTVPATSYSGLSNGYIITAQIGTAAGEYLYAVNGANDARLYDGATWTAINTLSTPAITGVATNVLSYVTVHKSRFWFIEKNSKRAWYLPVDSIGGAAVQFSLAGVFQRGGSLMFISTWSQDSGSGMDDRLVFVTTEGEVAVYAGTDPGAAATWARVGMYDIAKPLGPRCHMRAGGDILIGTESGLVPMSAVAMKDPAAIDVAQVTQAIEPSWRTEVKRRDGVQPWELVKWPRENMMMVLMPHTAGTQFIANLQTGAWTKYTGWDAQCGCEYLGKVYFAERTGFIFEAEAGGTDDGTAIVWQLALMPSDMGNPNQFKTAGAMQAAFQSSGAITAKLSIATDYATAFPELPMQTNTVGPGAALWGTALWDSGIWDNDGFSQDAIRPIYATGWQAVMANGQRFAPQIQVVFGGTGRPNAELLSIDVMLEGGGALV